MKSCICLRYFIFEGWQRRITTSLQRKQMEQKHTDKTRKENQKIRQELLQCFEDGLTSLHSNFDDEICSTSMDQSINFKEED